jgi:hypothetical protein
MDFSYIILIPLTALITACWVIGAAVLSKKGPGFQGPFILSYGLGVIFMQPWRVVSWQELGMSAVMLVMLARWIAAGCIIGGIPTMIVVSVWKKLRGRFGH